MSGLAAVVLAGGAGRRMGGADKPALPVRGRPMLLRVLAAVADARPRVVVGAAAVELPDGVAGTVEQPPGGGPVAATVAGLALVPSGVPLLALLAADLPLLTPAAVATLARAVAADSSLDGALYRDTDGRRQLLCGVWRTEVLRAAAARLTTTTSAAALSAGSRAGGPPAAGGPVAAGGPPAAGGSVVAGGAGGGSAADPPRRRGASIRALLDGLRVADVDWDRSAPPPWFDCDTDADLRRAEEWAR